MTETAQAVLPQPAARRAKSAWKVDTPTTRILSVLGDLLWLLTYIFTIRAGFRDHSYGIPLVAICLNFSWEFVFSLVIRPASKLRLTLTLLWLAFDAVILYQVFLWGAAEQIPSIRDHFVLIVVVTLVAATLGHISFHYTFHDPGGQQAAFIIDLVMSVLFVFLFLGRPDLRGLSYTAAWLKMFGDFVLAAGNGALMYKEPKRYGFFLFIFVMIFIFDVIYVCLMAHARG